MPDLIRHPVFFWIALKLHFVPRPLPAKGQARGNDNREVFNCRRNDNEFWRFESAISIKNGNKQTRINSFHEFIKPDVVAPTQTDSILFPELYAVEQKRILTCIIIIRPLE